jgi:hypothetical protein
MGTKGDGARLVRAPAWGALFFFAALGSLPSSGEAAWHRARVEARVDNLETLLAGCEQARAEIIERNQGMAAWLAYQAEQGNPTLDTPPSSVPECSAALLHERLAAGHPAVWAMSASAQDGLLFATVNLPVPGVLTSTDGGERWHWRHAFVPGFNVERSMLVRGLDYRHGLLAVASDHGVLLSTDRGLSFVAVLDHLPITAVAISPRSRKLIVAAGDGISLLSTDGGRSWHDLDFSGFIRTLSTRNRHVIDHVTSLQVDPVDDRIIYVGTGSHLYRLVREPSGSARWQAMEGGNAGGRVHDDSTVYNIAIGSRFMISTCNGVYVLERQSPDSSGDHAEVGWGKFRDGVFANREVGGPKGNLRSYFVTEDPGDPARILIADFAGLYEGRAERGRIRWRRVDGLPFFGPDRGYPEYTAIAWAHDGRAVIGSRYQGLFFQGGGPRRHPRVDLAVVGRSSEPRAAAGPAVEARHRWPPRGGAGPSPPWGGPPEPLCRLAP